MLMKTLQNATVPGRSDTSASGLSYAGAYTTPGIGMPMCLISGERTARAVREDTPLVGYAD